MNGMSDQKSQGSGDGAYQCDAQKLEQRLEKYLQSEDFQLDIQALAYDYKAQGLTVPPMEQLRLEAAGDAKRCLEIILTCEEKGHLWKETADPENGSGELTCRRCGTTEHYHW